MNHADTDVQARTKPTSAAGALYLDAARVRILAELSAHLRGGSGPMILAGETGSGRTTLLRHIAEEAAVSRLPPVLATHGSARSTELVAMLAGMDRRAAADTVGRAPGILIDDAEECPVAVWHTLAGLLREHPEPSGSPMPPSILAVPPDVLGWLRDLVLIGPCEPDARIRRLAPLDAGDVGRFVAARLRAAGREGPDVLSRDVTSRLVAATDALPGRIARLCDDALAVAGDGGRISIDIIASVLAATESASRPAPAASPASARPGRTIPFPGPRQPSAAEPRPAAPESDLGSAPGANPRPGAGSLPPVFGDETFRQALYRARRQRRRWRYLVGGAVAMVTLGCVVAALQPPRPRHQLAGSIETGAGYLPPAIGEPAPATLWAVPPSSPPPQASAGPSGFPHRVEVTPSPPPAGAAPVPVNDEETPETFAPPAPAPVERPKPAERTSPVGRPTAAAPSAAAATPNAAGAKVVPEDPAGATRPPVRAPRPIPATAAGPNADDPAAPDDAHGRPRPVKEIIAIGDEFRESGDIALARRYYEAARERGSAQATRALAASYDPRRVAHDEGDARAALRLYEQAAREGDRAAAREGEDLERWLDADR